MFDQINGMPLHPLLIHAPVLGIPLAFLLSGLFAFPRTREWARWALLITVLGATAATFAARESGQALSARLPLPPDSPVLALVRQHEVLADQLFYIMLGYAVITVAAVLVVKRRVAVPGDPASVKRSSRGPLGVVLLVLLLLVGIVATIWVIRVGDIGARAVWNPNSTGLFPF
jgi:uncharacterized membrane protein